MDKKKLEQLEEDMQKDIALLEEAKAKGESKAIAARLSQIFGKKYSSEFRGTFNVSYDVAENAFIMKCGEEEQKFNEADIDLIPEQLKLMRRQALLIKGR